MRLLYLRKGQHHRRIGRGCNPKKKNSLQFELPLFKTSINLFHHSLFAFIRPTFESLDKSPETSTEILVKRFF